MACDKVVAPDWMLRPVALGKRWQEEIRRLLMDLVWASKQYKDRPLGKAAAAALDGSGSLFLDVLGEDDVRPCLVYAADGGRRMARRFLMCPGEVTAVGREDQLWQAVEQGFTGTVFVPASLGHDLDLSRLSAYPGICVVIIPD